MWREYASSHDDKAPPSERIRRCPTSRTSCGGHAVTVKDLLAKHGITLASYAPGQHSTTCPTCSSRDRAYREKKCLGVKIDSKGACWRCSACGWSGPENGSSDVNQRPELTSYIYRDADGVERFRKVRNLPGKEPRFWL